MKIVGINSFYSNAIRQKTSETYNFFNRNKNMGDVVSFSAKQYSISSIINPTDHCAYCGCKVYSAGQIDGHAKGIMGAKFSTNRGTIRSFLEKLEGATNSDEIALAKSLENKDHIEFFRSFLEKAAKKPYMKGADIFKQDYGLEEEDAIKTIVEHLEPLKRDIDHIIPQNEEMENQNSDTNMVEACYCCNRHLKHGMSFLEFYTMFPSIKNNMPPEKFEAARARILDFDSNAVPQRLSAANLFDTIRRLSIQREATTKKLASIDERIKSSAQAISAAIETAQGERAEKEEELRKREDHYEQLLQDDEFVAITQRVVLQRDIEAETAVISQLNGRIRNISDSINEIRNPSTKKKNKPKTNNKKEELTEEQKQAKVDELKEAMRQLEEQQLEHEITKEEKEARIKELDERFPTVQMMQAEKGDVDSIISAHTQLAGLSSQLETKETELREKEELSAQLEQQIPLLPKDPEKPEDFPADIQEGYRRYLALQNALTEIGNQNGNSIRNLIYGAAEGPLRREFDGLSNNPLVVHHNGFMERKRLEKEKSNNDKSIDTWRQDIAKLRSQKERLEKTAGRMTKEEAMKKSDDLTEKIRSTTEKESYIKLPQIIDSIRAEIRVIDQTIIDLRRQLTDIKAKYSLES